MNKKSLVSNRGLVLVLAGAACACSGLAAAATLTVTNTYQFLDNVSANSAGLGPGVRQQFGSTCVVLTGNPCTPQNLANAAGTSGTATQGSVTLNMSFNAADLTSNHWFSTGSSALPDGQWTLSMSNGGDVTTALTPSLAGAQLIGFAKQARMTAGGIAPTFQWALPSLSGGATIDGATVLVRDLTDFRGNVGVGGLGVASIIYSNRALPASTTSLTIAQGDSHFVAGQAFQLGHHYALELQLHDTRNGLPANGFVQVLSQSRTLVDFTLSNDPLPGPLYLPMANYANPVPVYQFNGVPVQAGEQIFIDPTVAVGFDYRTKAGDPNFASVMLPTGVGDGKYELWLWDGAQWFDANQELTGGQSFSFAAGGVSQFRVTGIETSAGLNPVALNFVTGLTFVADGEFNGSMTPLVAEVPEPSEAVLLLAGLGSLLLWRRRSGS